jgi:hypothetical protein
MLSCPSFQSIRTSFSDGRVISAISGRSVETPPIVSVLTCGARFSATRRKARAFESCDLLTDERALVDEEVLGGPVSPSSVKDYLRKGCRRRVPLFEYRGRDGYRLAR